MADTYSVFADGDMWRILRPDGSRVAVCEDSKAAFEILELINRGHKWTRLRQEFRELHGAVEKFRKLARQQ